MSWRRRVLMVLKGMAFEHQIQLPMFSEKRIDSRYRPMSWGIEHVEVP
jgi:hypothetical protein